MKKSKSDAYFSRAASNIENLKSNQFEGAASSDLLSQSPNTEFNAVLFQPHLYSENLITDMQRRINFKNDLIEKFKTNKRFNPNKLLSTFYTGLLLLLLNSVASFNIRAQDSIMVANPKHDFKIFELGFKFMPTFSSFKLETTSSGILKSEVTPGFGFGTMMAINFTRHAGFQGELIYSALSQKYKDQNLEKEIKVRYINIPLLLSLNTNKANAINVNVVFGPQIGINLGSSFKTSSGGAATDTLSYVFAVKPSDLGIAYGAGFEFALDTKSAIRMDMGYRGVRGLMNINNSIAENNSQTVLNKAFVKTSSIYMGLTILF